MGIHLARELRNYFQQSGNKHLFANGLTLNELAWEMGAIAHGEVYPSILSKAINGHRLLTDWQVEAFCQVLGLTEAQRWRLSYAIAQDKCTAAGVDIHLGATPPTLDLIARNIRSIEQVRAQGMLQLALDMLYDLYHWQSQIEGTTLQSPIVRIFALMDRERAYVIEAIEHSRWQITADAIDLLNIPSVAELIEYIQTNTLSDVLNHLISTLAPLSPTERLVWEQRYKQQISVARIASTLHITPATVELLLLSARTKVIAYLQDTEELPEILE